MPLLAIVAVLALAAGAGFVFAGVARNDMFLVAAAAALLATGAFTALRAREHLRVDERGLTIQRWLGSETLRFEDMLSIAAYQARGEWLIGIEFLPVRVPQSRWAALSADVGTHLAFPAALGNRGLRFDDLAFLLNRARWARQPAPALAPERLAALAMSAVQTQFNRHRHDMLRGDLPSNHLKHDLRETLARDWGVRSAADLTARLKSLDETGHRAEYEATRARLLGRPLPSDLLDLLDPAEARGMDRAEQEEFRARMRLVAANLDTHPSLVGWDYARMIWLARAGAAAEILSEQQAWQWIEHAARVLRKQFDSFDAVGDNFLYGCEYWGGRFEPQRQAEALRFLRDDVASPWRTARWPAG